MSTFPRRLGLLALLPFILGAMGSQGPRPADAEREVDAVYAHADALYRDLHRHPELSGHEQRTAEMLASGLRALGYEVTTGVGRTVWWAP